ncbi:MAG: PilZ domain-containing protein [Planctomycetes bacterium]|nr:PilZ domain-containing protein [Planctomycetota bacterium]MCK5579100.1 PilZ domain-containing protein [Planctomycetota bacterium]
MPSKSNRPEHRGYKRYAIKGSAVQYKRDSFFGRFKETSRKYIVLDISESGIQFITKERFKYGHRLLMDISAPYIGSEVIHAKGKVARVKHIKDLHIYGVGVKFAKLEVADRKRLQTVLDNAVTDDLEISDTVYLNKAQPVKPPNNNKK